MFKAGRSSCCRKRQIKLYRTSVSKNGTSLTGKYLTVTTFQKTWFTIYLYLMKPRIIFPFLVICMVAGVCIIAGCKKNGASEGSLIGKWIFVQIDDVSHNNNGQTGTFTQSFDGGSFLQFNSDKTFNAVIDLSFDGTWQIAGNSLLLTNTGDTTVSNTFDIRTLSSRELVLYVNQPNDSGFVESTWHLKK